MLRISFAWLLISCLSCSSPKNQPIAENEYFEVNNFALDLVYNQSISTKSVVKTVELDGQQESKIVTNPDSTFWANELAIFLGTDLNKPGLKSELIRYEGAQDTSSNLLMDRYSLSPESDADLKSVIVYYLDDVKNIRKVYLKEESQNALFYSLNESTIWTNQYGQQLLVDSIYSNSQSWRLGKDTMMVNIATIVE